MSNNYKYKPYKTNNIVVNPDLKGSNGRLQPQVIEIEEVVLGAIMLEKNAAKEVIEFLKPEHFYIDTHRIIYTAIEELTKQSNPIDMRTVVNQLRKQGQLEKINGAYKVAELTTKVASAANIEYHARVIIEMAMRREIISITAEANELCYQEDNDIFELAGKVESRINKATLPHNTKNIIDGKAILMNTIKDMELKAESNGITGVPSGFSALDRVTGGWQNSNLIIIAARPGMGKTALVLNLALNATINFKIPIAIFSLEMSTIQLGHRMVSCTSEIDMDKVIKNKLDSYEWSRIMEKTKDIANAPIYLDDTSSLSIYEIKAKAKRMKEDYGIKMVIVDYIQLVKGDREGNREQEISSISRGLKQLSKDLDIPVIALSQLSRSVETRGGDKRPMLSDLRESGSLEQDADMVGFIYRPIYYGIDRDENGNNLQDVMEFTIAKNRQGATDNIVLKFIGRYMKVTDYDDQHGQSEQQTQTTRMPYKDNEEEMPF